MFPVFRAPRKLPRRKGTEAVGTWLRWRSSAQNDEEGLFVLSILFAEGVGCDKDVAKARELLERAAELGHVGAAMIIAESRLNPSENVILLCDTVEFGYWSLNLFYKEVTKVITAFGQNGSGGEAIFVMKGNVKAKEKEIFGRSMADVTSCVRAHRTV